MLRFVHTASLVVLLLFLGTISYGRRTGGTNDIRRLSESGGESRLRGSSVTKPEPAAGGRALAPLPPLGCPQGSAFHIQSTLFEQANNCYVRAAHTEFFEAYSPSGTSFSVDNRDGWGQAYVVSFNTVADSVEGHPSSLSYGSSSDLQDPESEQSSSLQKIGMYIWMATFISPYEEGLEGVNLKYKCLSSKVPLKGHPADAAPWSCVKDIEDEENEPWPVRVDPSQFSLHCGCDAIA